MIYTFIPTMIICCILAKVQLDASLKFKNGYICAVSFPITYMYDEYINELQRSGKKKFNIIMVAGIALSFLILLFDSIVFQMQFFIAHLFIVVGGMQLVQYNVMKKLREYKKQEDLPVNDDMNYDMLGYKNADDKRIFVQSKLSYGNYEINRGSLGGKIVFALTIIFLVGAVAAIPYFLSPSQFTYNVDQNTFEVKAKTYKDEVNLEDIVSVELKEGMPTGRVVRTGGTSIPSQSYGNFTIDGEKFRFYLNTDLNKYIELKRKEGKPILFNAVSDEETVRLYEELSKALK